VNRQVIERLLGSNHGESPLQLCAISYSGAKPRSLASFA
jgi:hypothetical protein